MLLDVFVYFCTIDTTTKYEMSNKQHYLFHATKALISSNRRSSYSIQCMASLDHCEPRVVHFLGGQRYSSSILPQLFHPFNSDNPGVSLFPRTGNNRESTP